MAVALNKPIQAHGNEVTELTIREPNAGDVAACGFPFSFIMADEGAQEIKPNAPAITALIARLGNIPLSSARSLSFGDWMSCMGEIFSFFGQSIPSSSSNGRSTWPGSGDGIPESPSTSASVS